MTAPLFSGRARRSVAALGAVTAGLLVLSACDKPTPLATVTVGSSSVSAQAVCRPKASEKELSEERVQECLGDSKGTKNAKSITYTAGDTLRLGVEPDVVEGGKKWLAAVGTQRLGDLTGNTYQSFPGLNPFSTGGQGAPVATDAQPIHIIELSKEGKPTAVWTFDLKLNK
ncbi:DUF2771 domain-containing protein [Streptomyces sp. G-G2]|uniref:DUF2771 domain-containing protein n=1 Tax=Streptomyces sp. G-G2 TaxID=3046201 RepID=UPI0024BBB969|nr:DUF2771 domain-containing protein [Streptomyces sp. G-G2]MDJ0384603.1 DUF2771 domain-containing protein [Streptomyces sp. G-G2]